jgi:hypothetical protein
LSWLFTRRQPADKDRQPMQGEFFTTESIDSIADSLIREFVQNSLDAADTQEPVQVRMRLGTIPAGEAFLGQLFGGLWDHVEAINEEAAALSTSDCHYLVIEDAQTTGLRGDPAEMFEPTSRPGEVPNEFFFFVRAEGKSSKSSAERGSWGIGKYTYPMASRINTFFALTCREDPSQPGGPGPLLIGQAILANHKVGATNYRPDGWWARIEKNEFDDDLPLPHEPGDEVTKQFCEAFHLDRTEQPGLSIVIPYIDEDLTPEAIVASVLKNYGVAVRLGGLEVRVDHDGGSALVDASSLATVVESLPVAARLAAEKELKLAEWWVAAGRASAITLPQPDPSKQVEWGDRITSDEASAIRAILESGAPVAVRLPIHVAPQKGRGGTWSYLDMALQPCEGDAPTPTFYREGIRVSEVRSDRISGIQAMVLINDRPLAEMLGAAEGPAHVDWQAATRRFRGRFARGKAVLGFIKNSPSQLVRQVRSGDGDEDRTVAAAFFFLPAPKNVPVRIDNQESGGDESTGGEPDIPPRQRGPVIVTGLIGGFRVAASDALKSGSVVSISTAYDVSRGNPLTKWRPSDFELSTSSVQVAGGTTLSIIENRARIRVQDASEFEVRGIGFDTNRDVFVKVEVEP